MKKISLLMLALCVGFTVSAQVKIEKKIGKEVAKISKVSKDASDQIAQEFKSKKYKRYFRGYKKQFKGMKRGFKRTYAIKSGRFKKIGKRTSRRIKVAVRN